MSDEDGKQVTAYPEHDKLGPLGARTSVLGGGGGDLRAALLGEFRDAVSRAQKAASGVGSGASAAVHEYRKGLRTARAVLALIEDALPRSERRAIRDILREARRAVSAARDQAVAPDALALLTLDDTTRTTAEAVLGVARAAAPPPDEIARVIADGANRAAAQADALDAALPPTIDWDLVCEGLAATYREARTRLKKARRSWKSFHAWRRRTKELTYQLDLLAKYAGPRTAALRDKFDAITDGLGGAVDLIMLRDMIVTHGAGLDRDHMGELLGRVDDQIDAAVRTARREGKDLFDRGARTFARKVSKATKKDLSPRTPTNGATTPATA